MLHLHDSDQVAGYLFGIGLLDELGENAFEVLQFGQFSELAGGGVGDNFAL